MMGHTLVLTLEQRGQPLRRAGVGNYSLDCIAKEKSCFLLAPDSHLHFVTLLNELGGHELPYASCGANHEDRFPWRHRASKDTEGSPSTPRALATAARQASRGREGGAAAKDGASCPRGQAARIVPMSADGAKG